MFENVLGQDDAVSRLRSDLGRDELPGALLFDGPPASAKLTAALELARASSCERDGTWNCPCAQCARHRLMSHQDLLLMGPKPSREELRVGAAMLERYPGPASRMFFVRAAAKLARRFDRELYEGEEGRLGRVQPLVRAVMEGIDACLPGKGDDAEAAAAARKLLPACDKLEEALPNATPVFQVRAMEFWARLAPFGRRKVVVIEHADRMLDSARNALLKILEEPPETAVFVLTTTRRQAMIPTILSRVRRYRFLPRTGPAARAVMERVFREPPGAELPDTVDGYLAATRTGSSGALPAKARAYAAAVLAAAERRSGPFADPPLSALAAESRQGVRAAIADAAAATAGFGAGDEALSWAFPAFLEETSAVFGALLRDPAAGRETVRAAGRWAALSRDALMRHASYNLNPTALAERLAAAMAGGGR